MNAFIETGDFVRLLVLDVASLLKIEAAPGIVTLGLLILLVIASIVVRTTYHRRRAALRWLEEIISGAENGVALSRDIVAIEQKIVGSARSDAQRELRDAWREYRETLVPHEEDGQTILRNSVRPSGFFNADDLRFSAGFWRIVPGLFVTGGLFLTFLGLISALASMDLTPDNVQASLRALLTIASAKFIMSLTGLACSIIFTLVLRFQLSRLEHRIHALCAAIEKRLTFISLEELAVEQLRAMREQRENFRMIGLELVAELGRPLREELPAAISNSISNAIAPMLQKVGQIGAEGMGSMVQDLSSRFSDDVGRALSQASERLAQAGDRIGQLSERMDPSSGRMGSEMDGAIARLTQAVDDLRSSMSHSAEAANGAFTAGADHLLAAMNSSLEAIRANTGEGARAMSAAAADMRNAAEAFKNELEQAARSGSQAAGARMSAAGSEASEAIGAAGKSVLDALGATSQEIVRLTSSLSEKASQELLGPLSRISTEFGGMVAQVADSSTNFRRLSDAARAGAEASERAAGAFRSASQDLSSAAVPIRASTERIELATRQLAASTDSVAQSTAATARNTADALASATQVLGGEAKAIEATLDSIAAMLDRLKGQGARLDDMDEKLGRAFDTYASQIETAVHGMFDHVRRMQAELNPALDTLRSIVQQAEEFMPESRRH